MAIIMINYRVYSCGDVMERASVLLLSLDLAPGFGWQDGFADRSVNLLEASFWDDLRYLML